MISLTLLVVPGVALILAVGMFAYCRIRRGRSTWK